MQGTDPGATETEREQPMPQVNAETVADDLLGRFRAIRSLTEALAAPLSPEDQTVQSMPDVSPTKWHRGHTTWFFETFVLPVDRPDYHPYHPWFGYLFNSYYEAVGARHPRPQRGLISRPGVGEVADYRQHVDKAVEELFATGPSERALSLLELGNHHEQQHQELLLMDIKHVLWCNPMLPAYRRPPDRIDAASSGVAGHAGDAGAPAADQAARTAPRATSHAGDGWIEHPGGLIEIGHEGLGFAFDNEMPRHSVQLVPFCLSERLVTCGEWLAFMEDGGYERPELWLSDGWTLACQQQWRAPLYWVREGDDGPWKIFTLLGPKPVAAEEPVCHVSYYEADAFARWSGCRLPTEQEWEAVASSRPNDLRHAHLLEESVLHPRGSSSLFGDVWQWTASSYSPYPGFRQAKGAVGEYNGKFMVNQYVLRGGSCVTPPGHVRVTYRNFFPASARWAFSGLRLARDA